MNKSFRVFLRISQADLTLMFFGVVVFTLFSVLLRNNSLQYALFSSFGAVLIVEFLSKVYVLWGKDWVILLRIKVCLRVGYRLGYYLVHFLLTLTGLFILAVLAVLIFGNFPDLPNTVKIVQILIGIFLMSMFWLFMMFRNNSLLDVRLRPMRSLAGHSTLLVYDEVQKVFVPTTGYWWVSRTVFVKGQPSLHYRLANASHDTILEAQPYLFKYVYY